MPTRRDSLRRAMREREIALDRGDKQTASMLDQVIDDLNVQIEDRRANEPQPRPAAGEPAGSDETVDSGSAGRPIS